jgi:lactobin A/cerein 7B family class IIb bacteriocin
MASIEIRNLSKSDFFEVGETELENIRGGGISAGVVLGGIAIAAGVTFAAGAIDGALEEANGVNEDS